MINDINPNHIKQRLEFCKPYQSFSKLRWRDICFSDEMNVEVDHRKNRVMLRRTPEEKYSPSCIVERTKQGSGSIGIWACMTYDGVKFFKLFNGRLNSESYAEILENYLDPIPGFNGKQRICHISAGQCSMPYRAQNHRFSSRKQGEHNEMACQ